MTTTIKSFEDMLTEIESTIEDWEGKAHGGDEFYHFVPNGVLQVFPNGVEVEGEDQLPHCLVGTVAYGLTGDDFFSYALTRGIADWTEKQSASLFLGDLIKAVDKDKDRDWQRAYDATLAKWGLA